MEKAKTRKCLQCNDEIPKHKRRDSKFCDGTCKARYWRESTETRKKEQAFEKLTLALLALTLIPRKKESFFKRLKRRIFQPRRSLFF